jgi:transposase-like protein
LGEPGPDSLLPVLEQWVEQDHRRIKSRVQPMRGFKKFSSARRVLIGIEFMHMVHKGQFDLMPI